MQKQKATRLLPQPQCEILAERIYSDVEFPANHTNDPELPYVAINTVTTLDGKTSWRGKSSGIGSDIDRYAMRMLRARSDAVLVGAGTVRSEKLSLTVPDDLAHWRESQGKERQPLGVILSRQGGIDKETLSEISPNILLLQGEEIPENGIRAYLSLLNAEYGVRRLLVEGGPTINHTLLNENIVDELFITLAPKIYGGEENNLVEGGHLEESVSGLELISTFLCGQELFLRYRVSFR